MWGRLPIVVVEALTMNHRLHKMAQDRARKGWGEGWEKLTDDHREVLYILVGQCDSLEKFKAAQEPVRRGMGWNQ